MLWPLFSIKHHLCNQVNLESIEQISTPHWVFTFKSAFESQTIFSILNELQHFSTAVKEKYFFQRSLISVKFWKLAVCKTGFVRNHHFMVTMDTHTFYFFSYSSIRSWVSSSANGLVGDFGRSSSQLFDAASPSWSTPHSFCTQPNGEAGTVLDLSSSLRPDRLRLWLGSQPGRCPRAVSYSGRGIKQRWSIFWRTCDASQPSPSKFTCSSRGGPPFNFSVLS